MAESREYVSRSDELGNIHISEEVLAVIAAAAALEVEGVGGLAANLGSDLASCWERRTSAEGSASMWRRRASPSTWPSWSSTATPSRCGRAVQEGIAGSVEATSGLSVAAVNVSVGGVVFDKEPKKAP